MLLTDILRQNPYDTESGYLWERTENGVNFQNNIQNQNDIQNKIRDFLREKGATQVGFCKAADNEFGLGYAISYTFKLSDAVIDCIDSAPTHTYFHHYRTVNAAIDRISLECGIMLERMGYRYAAVPASQSVNGMKGIYSHKRAANDAGLGTIGKSSLFISSKYGPRVRLGTILTDCEFSVNEKISDSICGDCRACVAACPAMAIRGKEWSADCRSEDIIDAQACSDYMKKAFKDIGRGAVCGICMRVCPKGMKNKKAEE